MPTQVHLHDGRVLTVDAAMRQVERDLRKPGPHLIECVGVAESGTLYGPATVTERTGQVRLLVDSELRRDSQGWDIIASDEDIGH